MGVHRSFLGVLVLSVSLACGDSGEGKGSQNEEKKNSASSACTALAEAICDGFHRCELIGDPLITECQWYFEESLACSTRYRVMQQDIWAGLIQYDSAAFGRCVDKLAKSASCDAVASFAVMRSDPDCTSFMKGTIAPGEPCAADACDNGDCLGSCPAVCHPRPVVGSPCTIGCGDRLRCVQGSCAPPGGVGEPCLANSPSPECLPGLVCAADGSEGVCALPGQEGETCNEPGRPPCSVLLACLPTPGGGPDTCQPLRPDWSACDPAIGGCSPMAECIGGTCQPLRGLGEECGPSAPCLPFYNCTAGTCTRKPSLGGSCSPTDTCLSGSCQAGICRIIEVSEGGFCDGVSLVCKQGSCVEGHCEGGCP